MTEKNNTGKARSPTRAAITDAAAILGLGLLAMAFFWKIIFTNQVLTGVDLFAYFYPYRDFASEALSQGRLPLWNPYLFMGAPLLANSQVAVLYPLHWPLMWLPAPKQIAWSIVLHIWIAGAGTYLFARLVMRRARLASLAGAMVFAFGGFLGAQVEHINQLNTSAWLPWLVLCLEGSTNSPLGRRRLVAFLSGCAVIALMLLAGHTQAVYIVLAAAGCYSLLRPTQQHGARAWQRAVRRLRGPGLLAAMAIVALPLAAGQLLSTIELSQLSVRSGGLEYREAASFSLKPTQALKAFLPPLTWEPPFSEFVAYVGITGLLLAGSGAYLAIRSLRRRASARPSDPSTDDVRPFALPSLGLTFLGIFLALGAYNPVYYILYKIVPGIGLFRVPARWLLLYAFGAALLAVAAADGMAHAPWAKRRALRHALPLAALLLLSELFLAGRQLAYNQPTAPAAYDSMRSATAHLLADTNGYFRFLSLSDLGYDPGDLGDLEAMFASELSQESLYGLVVATKMKEVLAYNLPMRYRIFSVDGYDGGLLPTRRYVALESLFLNAGDIWPDGRLRQQLKSIPSVRLLSLLNVRYAITDKLQDAWHEGIYYDLEAQAQLGEAELLDVPSFQATEIGVVSYLTGAADLPTGTPVAEVVVEAGDTTVLCAELRAGRETAAGEYDATTTAHNRALSIHTWRDNPSGNDYLARLPLERPCRPTTIRVRSLLPDGDGARVVLRGISLIDARTGTSVSVSIDPNLKLVHSGDVKVYENRAALPRAFIASQAQVTEDDAEAVALMMKPGFDPAQQVILAAASSAKGSEAPSGAGTVPPPVEVLLYDPERVELRASLSVPGYLVLTDAYYPGWQAEVDGRAVPILRADVYFRAVELDAGEHTVTFQYSPQSVLWGMVVGGAAWICWAAALAVSGLRAGRKRSSRV